MDSKRIHLISGPRNLSTALMYAFANRADTIAVDEPFYAYYLKSTGAQHPGREETMAAMSSDPDQILEQVILAKSSSPVIFFKNMSKHLTGLDLTFCQSLVNVFLIRDPEKLIASYAKVIRDIPESEVGLKAAWEQYQAMQEKGWKTVVLNSDIMLENPPLILAKLCQQIDIPFDPAMLKWEAGPRAEDGPWAKYWYSSVHRSTGFEAKPRQKIPLHEAYQPLLSRVKPYFDRLNQFTIRP